MVLCAAKPASHIAGNPSCGGLFGMAFARWSYAPTGRRDRGFIERSPMALCPNGAQGIAGSMNEAQWFYAPTGRKGIAQGKAKRRPGIRYQTIFASPERAELAVRKSMRTCFALSGLWQIGSSAYPGRSRTTQGGASLYPGLSHYAPLGRRSVYGSVLSAYCRRSKLWWVIRDGVCPMALCPNGRRDRGFIQRNPMVVCPNGAQGDSPGQSEAPPWDSVCPKQPKP